MARFESFWELACTYRDFIWLGLSIMLFLFILSVVGLVLAPPGSGAELISYANLTMILAVGSVMGWMYRVCLKRQDSVFGERDR